MTISRRKALALVGGGTIMAAAGAAVGFTASRTPVQALEPWQLAGQYGDVRKNILSYALLAPNPHNRQPWLVDLSEPETVVLLRDETRELPETDPYNRQIFIGLGCFLELMVLAAGAHGYTVELTMFPDGPDGPVSVARFEKGASADPLFAHVLDRRSCKEAFSETLVSDPDAEALGNMATIIRDPAKVDALKALTWDAWWTEATTHRTMKESVDLMRMGKREINANPDGIDMGGAFLETLMAAGVLTREEMLDPESRSFAEGARMYKSMLDATPAYAVIVTDENTRQDQINAGRRWLRLNLTTTRLGLALHPVSQCLQEFPEMAPHYASAHTQLAKPGQTVQMLGRLGYGPETPRTPRWPLETRITRETS